MQSENLPHVSHGFQGFDGLFLLRRYRQRQTVYPYVLFGDSVGKRGVENPFRDCDSLFRHLRDSVFIERQPDDRRAVLPHDGKDTLYGFLIPVDGVHRRLAVIDP